MSYLCTAVLLLTVFCIYFALSEGHFTLIFSVLWCLPVLGMFRAFHDGATINGLVVLICLPMFFFCSKGISGAMLWNLKVRKYKWYALAPIYLLIFLLFYYTYTESIKNNYLPFFTFGGNSGALVFVTTLFYGTACIPLTMLFYNWIDRLFSKKEHITIIQCVAFTNARGGLLKSFFLKGINNGTIYYFQMTRRTFLILRREPALQLTLIRGCLGGLYIVDNPLPQKERKALKRDRKIFRFGSLLFLITCIASYFLYFK